MRRADLTEAAYLAAMSDWQRRDLEPSLPSGDIAGEPLYRSRFLDAFTKTPPWSPYVLAGPLGAWSLSRGMVEMTERPLASLMAFGFGLLLWSLVEYLLHRFVFHASVTSETGRIAVFLAHGHHHVAPQDRLRIAATPLQMGSALLLLFGICDLVLDGSLMYLAFGGAIASYLAYEAVHYGVHHGKPRWGWLRALRRHHLAHHHVDPHSRFGIGSPLWDVLLRTGASAERHPV